MSSLACNFHLFACCILPPPAIICCYGSHIEKPHLCECLCAQLSPVASRINIIISAGHNIQKGIIQAQLEFILRKNLIGRNDTSKNLFHAFLQRVSEVMTRRKSTCVMLKCSLSKAEWWVCYHQLHGGWRQNITVVRPRSDPESGLVLQS